MLCLGLEIVEPILLRFTAANIKNQPTDRPALLKVQFPSNLCQMILSIVARRVLQSFVDP